MATTTTQPFHIRPGHASDVPSLTDLYDASFGHDVLVDMLFPTRHEHPREFRTHVSRLFQDRYWTLGFYLDLVVDEGGRAVGFSWWKRPVGQLTFYEKWVSPYAWFAPLMRLYVSLKKTLSPTPNINQDKASAYFRAFSIIEPQVLNTPRRRQAWYLSTLAVHPSLQGRGLGAMLLRHGLQKTTDRGVASWLVGLEGLDPFYERYGFVEVARANVAPLEHWAGGSVMFRE